MSQIGDPVKISTVIPVKVPTKPETVTVPVEPEKVQAGRGFKQEKAPPIGPVPGYILLALEVKKHLQEMEVI